MQLAIATLVIMATIVGIGILIYAALLDFAGLIRGDLGAQSQMQQRRYDDVVGLCERIEAILEARQIGVLKFHVAKHNQALNGTDNQV